MLSNLTRTINPKKSQHGIREDRRRQHLPNGVTKETFLNANTDSKLDILFDQNQELIQVVKTLQCKDNKINQHCQEQWQTCDTRFKKLERHWYKIAGGLVFLAAAAPFISTLIIKYWL